MDKFSSRDMGIPSFHAFSCVTFQVELAVMERFISSLTEKALLLRQEEEEEVEGKLY